jgi:hypothetical protein
MSRPLGLPVGSVRAVCLLSLAARAVLELREHHPIPTWLWAALLLSAAAYFSARAAHASTSHADGAVAVAPRRPPLWLPVGTIRLLFLGAVAYGSWLYFKDHRLTEDVQPLVIVIGAFVAGVLMRWFLAQVKRPEDASTLLFEHLQGFAAVAAAAGLVAIAVTHRTTELEFWVEPTLAAICTYYAGAR